MSGFIRTILGDIDPQGIGFCSAHEHVVIDSPHIAEHHADFLLDDVEAGCMDLTEFKNTGGGLIIDTMPGRAGRHAVKLAESSHISGVHIVAPTGLHLPTYYPPDEPMLTADRETLADWFTREIENGLEDDPGDIPCRAGVIKVAGDLDKLTDHQCEAFSAAGETSRRTGCPIITHTEQGTAGMHQIRLLVDAGADPAHIVLSHTDRKPDLAYHRELLQTGVMLEYDHHFRSLLKDDTCPTIGLIVSLIDDFPTQIVVGMDMARRSYWKGRGGGPGLAWLLNELPRRLREKGLNESQLENVLEHNAVRAYCFSTV